MITRRQFLAGAGAVGLGVVAGGLAACQSTPPPSVVSPSPAASRPQRSGAVADENLRSGTLGWDVVTGLGPTAAFADHISVAPGESLALHAAGHNATVDWYRLGWYAGVGGRRLTSDAIKPLVESTAPPAPDPITGLVEAPWPAAHSIQVPGDWVSGMYLAVLRPIDRPLLPSVVPFVVRPSPDATPSPVLFISAATTWQAYNNWGGKSLYNYNSTGHTEAVGATRAAIVSFDRPYRAARGAGQLRNWELQFVRWQERNGRSVDYMADVDLAAHSELLRGRRLVVFAGHPEYWSRPMRDAIEAAVHGGVNVAFLSANEMYWQVRLETSPVGPLRRVTCYRVAALDPLAATQPALTTCRWRERPVSQPEATLIGQMSGQVVRPADWVVTKAGHWLYEGTGLRDGDRIAKLVGDECDTYYPALAPPGTEILARSPVVARTSSETDVGAQPTSRVQTATIYTASSGATVFAAGTLQWALALDPFNRPASAGIQTAPDPRVERVTANLYDRLGDGVA